MKIDNESADQAVTTELGRRLARARLDRDLSQAELARQAGVSKRTLEHLEAGDPVQLVTLLRVCRQLDLLDRFEQLVPDTPASPLQQLKLHGRQRQRSSGQRRPEAQGDWHWDDDA